MAIIGNPSSTMKMNIIIFTLTFFVLAWLHEQEQILNKLLGDVGYETIDDPMPNNRLKCAPFF
jgi:hypothetical protein